MRVTQLLPTLALCLTVSTSFAVVTPDIVYDDSTDNSGFDYESTDEYGDEVILGGTSRAITQIQLEIYAQFTDSGTQLARVRFYKNDGPLWNNQSNYPTPDATPLFEQSFALSQGYQTAVVDVPNVVVPDHFTYTVQFLGISQTSTNDRAGLLFYGVPTVGNSFDDFWDLTPTGWAPLARTDVPKNNFGARILAVPGPQPELVITRIGNNVQLSWPSTYTGFTLEYKNDMNAATWTPAGTATLNGSSFQITLPIGANTQIFRLRLP
jgi:hypothetical protein